MRFDVLHRQEIGVKGGHVSFLHTPTLDKPLVLLPGSFSDAHQFEAMLAHFPGDLSVIIIETRGHGESWPPAKHGSIQLFARDVILVLDVLRVQAFFVGGHSIGGMIAIEVGRTCSHRVLGIVSIEGWTNHKAVKKAYKQVPNNHLLTPEQERERLESRARVMANWSRQQVKQFGSAWKRWDGWPILASTTIPVIEIYGDRGMDAPSREDLLIPRKENIQLVIIENGSHSLPLQHPDKLASIIMPFLKAHG